MLGVRVCDVEGLRAVVLHRGQLCGLLNPRDTVLPKWRVGSCLHSTAEDLHRLS